MLNFQVIAACADITFETEPEHSPATECHTSGETDPDTLRYEARENAKVQARLDDGDEWAWCTVKVTATSAGGVVGVVYLGGCSYADADDFQTHGLYDMAIEARASLATELERIHTADFGPVSTPDGGESVTTTADRILATIINGNRRDAREEFRAMTPGRAAAVAGYLVDAVRSQRAEVSSALRLLESCDETY